jgi:hypothetical protein
MTELLEKGKIFEWTPRRESSFQELKKGLTTTPVLTMPNMERPFSIYCDTSGQGFGMCVDARRSCSGICFKAIKKTRREVPNP